MAGQRAFTVAMVLGLVSALDAQRQVVVPLDNHAQTYDNQGGLTVFQVRQTGSPQHKRFQGLFAVDSSMVGQLQAIAFRRFNLQPTGTPIPAFSADLELRMCHSPRTVAMPSWVLSDNLGPDQLTVFDRRMVRFAAEPYSATGAYAFSYTIPFDRPFPLIAGRVGLWEMWIRSSTLLYESNPVDAWESAWRDSDAASAPIQSFGSPCGYFSGDSFLSLSPPLRVGFASMAVKAPLTAFTSPNVSVMFGGVSAQRWGPLVLPFNLTGLGAPGCHLYISLDWTWPLMADQPNSTFANAALDIPADPTLQGQDVYLQGFTFGSLIPNPLRATMSQGIRARIGPPLPVFASTVYAPPSYVHSPFQSLDYGNRLNYTALVFQLTIQ